MDKTELEGSVEIFTKSGFEFYDHVRYPVGRRVYPVGERSAEKREQGSAVIVWVGRKSGEWEQTYGRKNIEILVKKDRGGFRWWTDYGTIVVKDVGAEVGENGCTCPPYSVGRVWGLHAKDCPARRNRKKNS